MPHRYFRQRLPNPLPECRAAHIERKAKSDSGLFHETDDTRDQRFVILVAADEAGLGEPVLKAPYQRIRVVAEQDRCDTLRARCD